MKSLLSISFSIYSVILITVCAQMNFFESHIVFYVEPSFYSKKSVSLLCISFSIILSRFHSREMGLQFQTIFINYQVLYEAQATSNQFFGLYFNIFIDRCLFLFFIVIKTCYYLQNFFQLQEDIRNDSSQLNSDVKV